MSQFAAFANADDASRKVIPYWLNVQSDLIAIAGSRVVVPLITCERAGAPLVGLMPEFKVAGKVVVMDTAQITSVPLRMLGRQVSDLSDERPAIMTALDLLISGI